MGASQISRGFSPDPAQSAEFLPTCVCVSSLQSFHLRVCVHVCVWRGVDLEKVAFPLGLTVLQRGSEITVLFLVKLLLIH